MSESKRQMLPSSEGCFVCGEENEAGLRSRFCVEDGVVAGRFRPGAHHCGFAGVVHGGIVASMLDETMSWAAACALKRMCVTGEMTVRYILNVPDDRELVCVTRVEKSNRRMATTSGELVDEDGTKYASATAKFLPMTEAETVRVDGMLKYRDGDVRLFEGLGEG